MQNKRIDITEAKKRYQYFDGTKDISKLGAGDSFYISNFLKKERNEIFEKLMKEAKFVQMFQITEDTATPIPRLVTAQAGHNESGASAIYRMPGCNEKNIQTTDWTPTVRYVCERASEEIGQKFNHCVLTLFRDQEDSLGFHKDKLVDLKENSLILSVSFGDARPILFHSVEGKHHQTLMLLPGSLLAIGPMTNKLYMHAIPKLTDSVGPRVSLSLRSIDTYIQYEDKVENCEQAESNKSKNFKILGKGAEYQCTNYPFITSYDDPDSYSDEVKRQIELHSTQNSQYLLSPKTEIQDILHEKTQL
jgi:alkylated DNA repair dioxygenase AlkB